MDELGAKSVTGIIWTAGGKVALRGVQFALGIVLARLLTPSDFGLVGMLGLFLGISALFVDCGLPLALIRKQNRSETDCSTVLWFSLALGVICYAVVFAAAPALAAFFHEPRLALIARVVSTSLLFGALASVPQALLRAHLRFRAQTLANVVAAVVSGLVGIALALKGWGVWALVGHGVTMNALGAALAYAVTRWRPRLLFSCASLRESFDFGWKMLGTNLVTTFYSNLHSLVIGRSFGMAEVGNFARADSWTQLPPQVVYETVGNVGFPVFSRLQHDSSALWRAYVRLSLSVAAFLVLLMAAIAVFCAPLVRLVLGEQWLGCVPLMRILAVGAVFDPLLYVATVATSAFGRSDLVLKLELCAKGTAIALLMLSLPFGLEALCCAKSASPMLALPFFVHFVWRSLKRHGND